MAAFIVRMGPLLVLWLAVFLSGTWAVDRGNFKTCDQSAFCKEFSSTSNRPHNCGPRVATPAQDLYIRLLHLRDLLRPATWKADETGGLHNRRISAQIARNRLREAHLRARPPKQGLDLTAVQRHN